MPLLLYPFWQMTEHPTSQRNRSHQMDMPLSVCHCLCKPPLIFAILSFLHRESSLPPSSWPLFTCALGATCPCPSDYPETSHSGSFFIFSLHYFFYFFIFHSSLPKDPLSPVFKYLQTKPMQIREKLRKHSTSSLPQLLALFLSTSLPSNFLKFLIILTGFISFLCIHSNSSNSVNALFQLLFM